MLEISNPPEKTPGIIGPASLLLGTIVGAGIFALPGAAAASGFFPMALWGAFLAGAVLLLHLMFAEIVLRTGEKHRLPGYVRMYLGERAGTVSLLATLLGASGALLIYLVLFEDFIGALVPGIAGPVAVAGYWAAVSTLVVLGIKTVEKVELWMAALLILIIGYLSWSALPLAEPANILRVGEDPLLPFGVLLFAFGGLGAIPEMQPFFGSSGKRYAAAVRLGMGISAVLYLIFTASFSAAFGTSIGDDITVPVAVLGKFPLFLVAVFGIAAITSSFLVIGSYLKNTLRLDMAVSQKVAPLILLLPLIAYAFGARNFVALVGLVGAVFTGASAFFIIWAWKRARKVTQEPTYALRMPEWAAYPLLIVFLIGVVVVLLRSVI